MSQVHILKAIGLTVNLVYLGTRYVQPVSRQIFVTFWESTSSISWVALLIKITAPEAPMTIAEAEG